MTDNGRTRAADGRRRGRCSADCEINDRVVDQTPGGGRRGPRPGLRRMRRADAVTLAGSCDHRLGPGPCILRKEVIQPQVPLRLPCYDLVPITGFIFGA